MRVYMIGRKTMQKGVVLLALLLLGGAFLMLENWRAEPAMVPASPIYQGKEGDKQVALCCNVDWGEEHLPRMLETLKKHNAKATFFLSGRWTDKFPEMAKAIAEAGHEIGNHGYSHPHPTRIGREENEREIRRTEEAIAKATGKKTNLFAPPYGEFDRRVLEVAEAMGYKTVMWTVDTIDWQKPAPSVIVKRVSDKLADGAIVLMHPTAQTAQALPELLKILEQKGYQAVTLTEALR